MFRTILPNKYSTLLRLLSRHAPSNTQLPIRMFSPSALNHQVAEKIPSADSSSHKAEEQNSMQTEQYEENHHTKGALSVKLYLVNLFAIVAILITGSKTFKEVDKEKRLTEHHKELERQAKNYPVTSACMDTITSTREGISLVASKLRTLCELSKSAHCNENSLSKKDLGRLSRMVSSIFTKNDEDISKGKIKRQLSYLSLRFEYLSPEGQTILKATISNVLQELEVKFSDKQDEEVLNDIDPRINSILDSLGQQIPLDGNNDHPYPSSLKDNYGSASADVACMHI